MVDFGDLYVWWHGSKYELAQGEGTFHRVGETYFECPSVGGVYDSYTVGEHGVMLHNG